MEKPNEGQSPPEQKEADYVSAFKQRIQEIGPTPHEDLRFDNYEIAGFEGIHKEIPAMIFRKSDILEDKREDWNIWITDPKEISDKICPHHFVRNEYRNNSGRNFPHETYCSWILEDGKRKLSIILDESFSRHFSDQDNLDFLKLLERYNISKVIGFSNRQLNASDENKFKDIFISDENLIGKSREDLHLLNIAQEHGMTNNQFLRLRQRAHSARDAKISFDAEDMAKEIVTEEGHI